MVVKRVKNQLYNDKKASECAKNIITLEEYLSDSLKPFKQPDILIQVEARISSLWQYPNEKVFLYGLRAQALNEELISNYCLYFDAKSAPAIRFKKVEKMMPKFFVVGLHPCIRCFIITEPTSLENAIEMSLTAEFRVICCKRNQDISLSDDRFIEQIIHLLAICCYLLQSVYNTMNVIF